MGNKIAFIGLFILLKLNVSFAQKEFEPFNIQAVNTKYNDTLLQIGQQANTVYVYINDIICLVCVTPILKVFKNKKYAIVILIKSNISIPYIYKTVSDWKKRYNITELHFIDKIKIQNDESLLQKWNNSPSPQLYIANDKLQVKYYDYLSIFPSKVKPNLKKLF